MGTEQKKIAAAYYRLSREESQNSESSSIANQRSIVRDYCERNDILLYPENEFVDDGYSGANFDRPGFNRMLEALKSGVVNTVITKDLSRLGRGMRESYFYAEDFFPQHNIVYIAIADGYVSGQDNKMAPFQFAMNEFYLREGSSKVKDVLKNKREKGEYCACPPYGYKKDPNNKNKLVPDENTAPVVKRIFEEAAGGLSTRKIALKLNEENVMTPLMYRVVHRDKFGSEGASRATDYWNYTTVKRILKNKVYLGHTILGKTKKVSFRSKEKVAIPEEEWAITYNTHEPIVSESLFDKARINMGKGTKDFRKHEHVRKSIFGGIAYCSLCGSALCSAGSVYKGEREKYWYLACNKKRKDIAEPCVGVRIKYSELMQIVKEDLNSLITLSKEQIDEIVKNIMRKNNSADEKRRKRKEKVNKERRLKQINTIMLKLYADNADGLIDNKRLSEMISQLQNESNSLNKELEATQNEEDEKLIKFENYQKFFNLAKQYSKIEELDRDTLITFIERIEIGPKILPEGYKRATHKNSPSEQSIKIIYKFIGEANELT